MQSKFNLRSLLQGITRDQVQTLLLLAATEDVELIADFTESQTNGKVLSDLYNDYGHLFEIDQLKTLAFHRANEIINTAKTDEWSPHISSKF